MPAAARMPYQDPDQTTATWVVIFVLASLLVHALIALGIILMSIYLPPEKLDLSTPQNPEVSLSLLPPPPPPAPPQQKRPFIPTLPQPNVQPRNTLIESDNNVNLTSPNQTSRKLDSVLPDVTSRQAHPDSLQQSPNSPAKEKPRPATPGATTPQKAQPLKAQPTPPQSKPSPATQQRNQPTQNPSTATKPPPTPAKTQPPKPVQYDPNGLPLLAALDAPPIEPQTPETAAQAAQSAVPPESIQQVPADVQGKAGLSGAPSPEAMKTALGEYKAKVYRAVGSRWYEKVDRQIQVLPVGSVHIQFTIYSNGTVSTTVLDSGNVTMQLLLSISRNSITEAAPFDPFPPGMLKELGTDSYTDDFTFSVYGH
jgi:hypothetical protein